MALLGLIVHEAWALSGAGRNDFGVILLETFALRDDDEDVTLRSDEDDLSDDVRLTAERRDACFVAGFAAGTDGRAADGRRFRGPSAGGLVPDPLWLATLGVIPIFASPSRGTAVAMVSQGLSLIGPDTLSRRFKRG